MMSGFKGVFENLKPYVLMVCLQFGFAGMYIISMVTLTGGMNRYVLIVYRNAVAAIALAPFALILERKVRPKMTLSVFGQIMILGFLEPILDQGFAYWGMTLTSASFTSAIMNAVPSITFIVAVIFRLEKVNIREVRSQAKVIGTMVSLGGAVLMTVYKGPALGLPWSSSSPSPPPPSSSSSHHDLSHDTSHWVEGTLLIFLGCVAWSCFYVLQSVTIKKYPANLSLSAMICLAGAAQSTAIALAVERRPNGWAVGWDSRLFAPLYSGIVSSGITYYVQGLVMKTRGPVFVTAFNPLCMILVAALASFILSEKIHLGSIVGGVIIAIGLYSVVWGKGKDYHVPELPSTPAKDSLHELPITGNGDTKLMGITIGDSGVNHQINKVIN